MKFNLGKLVKVEQGSPEWLALRAERDTASEAPAMMGKSKYQTRNALMDQKATGVVPEPSEHQKKAFDKGHQAEAAARPIADAIIDDELYPVVLDDAVSGYLASMDGLTMCRRIGWEHKWLSADLAAQIDAGELDEHYRIQLDQQFALSGAERILFMASDGTEENCKYLWIERDESRFAALEAGWEQFRADLAEYQPRKQEQAATGATTEDLPAVSVQVSGDLSIVDNFDRFESALKHFIDEVLVREPKNDQDFADLDNQVKALKKAEDALDAAEAQLLAQVEAVDTAKRRKDMLHKLARDNRLMAEKLVKEQKKAIKLQIAQDAKQAVEDHGAKVQATLDGYTLPRVPTDFNEAMKGKRTITTLRDAADNEVARAKIAINEAADLIRANAKIIADAGHEFLFADRQQLALKDSELVKLEVESRITRHKQEEERRLEAERQRIAAEEKAKAERAAQQKADAEKAAQQSQDAPKAEPVAEQPAQVDSEQAGTYRAPEKTAPPVRPSDQDILRAIAAEFQVDVHTAAAWVLEMNQQELERVA
ncbi:YqaJ viral recombinase family protein [Alcanivorax jadensis]|uniref:YqaJ viral recombinase family protein n=3 Tax=Alcanivorax TaxID=59753 RepID=UPI002352D10B|nr:YqaJ viral recombinase family protein [Alcanivorax jadensis]|tara:strand:+ start:24372 stop:25991 length:1620 start_codon:yes stop_codon:yes gene_type:complete